MAGTLLLNVSNSRTIAWSLVYLVLIKERKLVEYVLGDTDLRFNDGRNYRIGNNPCVFLTPDDYYDYIGDSVVLGMVGDLSIYYD